MDIQYSIDKRILFAHYVDMNELDPWALTLWEEFDAIEGNMNNE